MKIIKPSARIVSSVDGDAILKRIEEYGRVCYKSEARITEDSAKRFVENLVKRGHESVLEHISVTVKFVCDRGVSHEIVRHRLASYSQESTRFCNYSKDDFGSEVTVIEPCFLVPGTAGYDMWYRACQMAEQYYFSMLDWGCTPEEARAVLPNSLKTELVMTANLREWRHFFKLRASKAAHPQMRELTVPLLGEFKEKITVVFDDIKVEE
jgi:thymidylate synthase (FAD)